MPLSADLSAERRFFSLHCHGLWRLLALWLLGVLPHVALALPAVIDGATLEVDLWSAVEMLSDPEGHMDVQQAQAAADRFAPPRTARWTLGLHREPVWLRVPFSTSATVASQWVLNIDYPAIDRINVYLVQNGQVQQQAALGNLQVRTEHARAARTHALRLQLQPGQSYELFLRVDTTAAMVMPLTLSTPEAFLAHALRSQMLQGLLCSLSVCLLLYSVALGLSTKDALFLKFDLIVLGGLGFSLQQFGVGAQYLWPGNRWVELHIAPLAALVATAGFFLFFEHVLVQPGQHRQFTRVMKVGAAVAALVALLFACDLLTTHNVSDIVGVLGVLPLLLALPLAIRRVRQRDAMGVYVLLAILVYCVSTATMVGVIFGTVAASFWAVHSVQFAGVLDGLLLMRMLGVRARAIHSAAQRATQELDAMHSLAHTDPLTGLPNRRGLQTALTTALLRCTPEQVLAVFMLDLDGFKPINDQFGHDVGDELLVAVAARLQTLVRHNDVVARLGGDEFVVMASSLNKGEKAIDLGNKILEAFSTPFQLSRQNCQVGLTIGYALAPLDGLDAKTLLKVADAGMYLGKSEGKHCLRRVGQATMQLPSGSTQFA